MDSSEIDFEVIISGAERAKAFFSHPYTKRKISNQVNRINLEV